MNYSKNCYHCFDCDNCEDLIYSFDNFNLISSIDAYLSGSTYEARKSELVYDSENLVNIYHCLFSSTVWDWTNDIYCDTCFNCQNLFGCIWLRNKQYCILNKQYTKEEYEQLVPKIIEHMKKIGEWWEFFPASISPFWYNETVANEYYPLTKEEVIRQWFKWQDKEYPVNIPDGMPTMKAEDLPENIKELTPDLEKKILNSAIICKESWKPYRIIKQEIEFYKKHNLPLPRKHPDIRHLERMKLRNPRKLYDRKCAKCGKDIKTTYAPDRLEIVYCQECYKKEVY